MQTEDMIPLTEFCMNYHVEQSFVYALQDSGLIEIIHSEEQNCILASQLQQLEKMVRMNTEMDINLEGIEVITHLLERIQKMQRQILELNNKLNLYKAM